MSIRGLLLLVLLIAIWLGWAVHKAKQQREAAAAVRRFGGWVHYDYEFVNGPVKVPQGFFNFKPSWGKLTPGRKPWAPGWLRRTLGDEYFQEIVHASLFIDIEKGRGSATLFNIGPADDTLAKLSTQTHVRTLLVGGQQITDENLASVGKLTSLEELIISPGRGLTDRGISKLSGLKNLRIFDLFISDITDTGLESLGELTNMEELNIQSKGFSDRGLAHLRRMTRLKRLSIGHAGITITDAGLEALTGMTQLEEFDMIGWPVTDASIDTLIRLKSLKTLGLNGTNISEAGRERLKQALPGLKIK